MIHAGHSCLFPLCTCAENSPVFIVFQGRDVHFGQSVLECGEHSLLVIGFQGTKSTYLQIAKHSDEKKEIIITKY